MQSRILGSRWIGYCSESVFIISEHPVIIISREIIDGAVTSLLLFFWFPVCRSYYYYTFID